MNLENNSMEMKTVVETFVIEETAELIYDDKKLDKWNELVKDLGLEGQEKVVKPTKSPIPYLFMNTNMENIAGELCPRKVDFKDYDVTPIPLEILEHISLSVRESYFEKIQIWYDDKTNWYDDKTKDPFAVGITEVYKLVLPTDRWSDHEDKTTFPNRQAGLDYIEANGLDAKLRTTWDGTKTYLIGKWADVKRGWDELKGLAEARYRKSTEEDVERRIKECKRELEDLDNKCFERFG